MKVIFALVRVAKLMIVYSIIDLCLKVTAATWQGRYYLHVSTQQPSYEPPSIPEYNKG